MLSAKPHFPSIGVAKIHGKLVMENFQRLSISIGNTGLNPVLSSRAESTMEIIRKADLKYSFNDFEPVLINVGDSDDHFRWGVENSIKILNYCTRWDNFEDVCPDFIFDKWKEAGYSDYDSFCNKVNLAGLLSPENDAAVWRGSVAENKKVRNKLFSIPVNQAMDFKNVASDDGNPSNCVSSVDYMPITEQAKRYRFIINANGQGHSRRLKIELFSGRVIFVIERRYEEWFHCHLKPWVHYVPVKNDVSDLLENIEIIKSSPYLEQEIKQNAVDFAFSNLRFDNALDRFNYLLNDSELKPNDFNSFRPGRYTEMDCRDDDYR